MKKKITATLSKPIQAIQHEYHKVRKHTYIYWCIWYELINIALLFVIIYIQGTCKEQLESKLTTHFCKAKFVLNF